MQEIYINHRMAAAISTTGETVHVKLLYAGSKNLLDAGTATVTSLRACLEKQIEGVQEIMLLPLEGADPDYSIELKFSGAQKSSVREDVVISLIKQAFDAELKVDKLCNLPSAKKIDEAKMGRAFEATLDLEEMLGSMNIGTVAAFLYNISMLRPSDIRKSVITFAAEHKYHSGNHEKQQQMIDKMVEVGKKFIDSEKQQQHL